MKKTIVFIFIASVLFSFVSCTSVKEIPTDLTASQLLQNGQTALGNGNYKVAEQYFTTTIQRYGMDTQIYVEAKYELGHLYMKKKNYEKAYENFSEILEIYENAPFGSLTPAHKKLTQLDMARIPEDKLAELQGR